MATLSDQLGARGIAIFAQDLTLRSFSDLLTDGIADTAAAYFEEGWYKEDYRERAWAIMNEKGQATDDDINSQADRETLPYYQFLRQNGVNNFIAMPVSSPLGTMAFAIYFRRSEDGSALLGAGADALRHAVQAAMDEAIAQADTSLLAMQQAAHALGYHATVIDAHGKALPDARQDAAGQAGNVLDLSGGPVSPDKANAPSPPTVRVWSNASQWRPALAGSNLAHQTHRLVDIVAPPPAARHFHDAPRLVCLWRPAPGAGPTGVASSLTERFGLTSAEARIAISIAEGHKIAQIASVQGRSVGTVRQHVKAVLRKTGLNSQNQLTAMMSRLDC